MGFRVRSRWQRIIIFQKYVKWCIANRVNGACDGMLHIDNVGLGKVRTQMVANPLQLQRYLDVICEPESEQTTDNIYRCFYWMAYSGMGEEAILNAKCWVMVGQQSDASQCLGSGLTYSMRYFLLKYFNVATPDDDPDNWRSKQKAAEAAEDSIFDREKPLCEKTIQRIAKGFKKFVLDEPDPYMVDNKYLPYLIQYHSEVRDGEVRGQKVTDPIMTLDTSNRYALIMPYIVTLRNNMVGQSVREPLGTITAGGGHHMAVYAYLIKYYGKLVGVIDWSWWVVLIPLWFGLCVVGILAVAMFTEYHKSKV